MTLVRVIAAGLVAVMASACAGGAPPPAVCAAIGAVTLGGGGSVLGGKLKDNHDGGAYAAGAAIGAVVGGATGYAICSALQEEKKPAPAPAPAPVAPAPAPAPVKEKIVLRGVNFDFDKYNIRPDAKVILDEAITILKRNPDAKVAVNGHTDSIGTEAYNLKLSDRRANAVVDYFVKGGLDKTRFTAKGFGEGQPIAPNDTKEGRAKNRRVELLTN